MWGTLMGGIGDRGVNELLLVLFSSGILIVIVCSLLFNVGQRAFLGGVMIAACQLVALVLLLRIGSE